MFPVLNNIFDVGIARAQSPALPIFSVFRDIIGGEAITTTAQTLSWDTEVSENAEIPIDAGNDGFDLTAGGHYLVMYSVPIRSSAWTDRSEAQSWLRVNGSTSVPYSYGSSYIRRVDSDFEWYNEGAAVIDVSPWDNIELRMQQTDTHTADIERTPNRSGINILKLDDIWDYARLRPSVSQAVLTSWEDVHLGTSDELDAGAFSISWNDVTLSGTWKYLVTYSVWTVTTGTDRTNNEMRLTLDSVEVEATRSTAYARAQLGTFTGIASYIWIIETTSVNQILNLEVRRESTLQWDTNDTVPSKTGITITKLPDDADYVRVWEAIWGQDITTTTNTPLTFDDTIEQGTDLEHDSINTSEIDINTLGDYMFFHSIYNAQNFLNNASRENPYLEWQVSWVTVPYGVSGSYNRHSDDGDGQTESSHSSAWVILPWLAPGNVVELTETNEAANGWATYKAGFMGIQWVSLKSLFSGAGYLSQPSYRWRDDSTDFSSDGGWLANENTDISNISKNETVRLRMKVENPSVNSYDTLTQFKLQWAETAGTCSSGLLWNNMEVTGDEWEMIDSVHISPNAETSATQLLSNVSWNTHIISEGYHISTAETLSTAASSFTAASQKEYEFSLRATPSAVSNIGYCFRLYNIAETKGLDLNNFPKIQIGATPVILNDVWWEAGKVDAPIDGWWTNITYTWGPYTTPVIVWRTNTYNDGNEALVFEARNVTGTWADVRLCDSNAWNATWCQAHGVETIGYIVVDASQTSSVDGIEAGTFSATQSFDTWPGLITTSYSETFFNIPYVFTSIQTTNTDSPIVTRVSASTIWNFSGGICQQNSQDGCNGSHGAETFWWIAVDPTINPFLSNMDIWTSSAEPFSWTWVPTTFSTTFDTIPVGLMQAVTNNGGQDVQIDEIQNVTLTWMEYRSCELDNDDDCDTHNPDTLRWLAIEEWVFAPEYVLDKTHYGWYENNSLITPVTALADENSTLQTIPVSNQLRLRTLVQNADPELPSWVLSLKLQYWSGAVCESISTWIDVWAPGGWEDWVHYDDPSITDGTTITSSLLWGGWHVLQSYNESNPTVWNPNSIPVWEWGEWDFSLLDNSWVSSKQYCFRVVTQAGSEIAYSRYAEIDTTDLINPSIDSFSPYSWALLPIWNFDLEYTFSDADSGIDITSETVSLQKWDGATWGTDISGTYTSLEAISATWATYQITSLEYGRYRAWFAIQDNSWNTEIVLHEFYVDAIEFIISTPEVDIWNIALSSTGYTSADTLTVTVRTVGAAFAVTMLQQTDLDNSGDIIPDWDGTTWFGYEPDPYGTINSFWLWATIANEAKSLNINGNKNIYTYDIKYSVLLDILENYSAWDYESLLDFQIQLDYN